MPICKIVGRGVDTLVLNISYADKQFQPIKQELAEDLQNELNLLQSVARFNEAPILTPWALKGIHLFMQEKCSRGQWRWKLQPSLFLEAISRGRRSRFIVQVCLWSRAYLREANVEVGLFLYIMFVWVPLGPGHRS